MQSRPPWQKREVQRRQKVGRKLLNHLHPSFSNCGNFTLQSSATTFTSTKEKLRAFSLSFSQPFCYYYVLCWCFIIYWTFDFLWSSVQSVFYHLSFLLPMKWKQWKHKNFTSETKKRTKYKPFLSLILTIYTMVRAMDRTRENKNQGSSPGGKMINRRFIFNGKFRCLFEKEPSKIKNICRWMIIEKL